MTDILPNDAPSSAVQTNRPILLWSAIGVMVVIVAAGGYFVWGKNLSGTATTGPGVCQTMLTRARDFGVVPSDATLMQPDAVKNESDGRPLCKAQSNGAHYTMTADLICTDMTKQTCLSLYNVRQDDGTSLFQRRM
ncbi:MAG TPA: hypothetical protein VGT78_14325 [Rhizomicrobium sp.]|nr:hypothetical protein [Rhizomicrobium sp.]